MKDLLIVGNFPGVFDYFLTRSHLCLKYSALSSAVWHGFLFFWEMTMCVVVILFCVSSQDVGIKIMTNTDIRNTSACSDILPYMRSECFIFYGHYFFWHEHMYSILYCYTASKLFSHPQPKAWTVWLS